MSDLAALFETLDVMALRMGQLVEALEEARADHADLKTRVSRMFVKGKVTDVDPQKHLYRQEVGVDDQGNPVKSPWLPYSQRAGARKDHSPPSIGEQYMAMSPDGDIEQALGVPLGWSNDNPSPSTEGDADVSVRGSSKDTVKGNSRLIESETITLKATTIILDGAIKLGGAGANRALALMGSIDSNGDTLNGNLATKVFAL